MLWNSSCVVFKSDGQKYVVWMTLNFIWRNLNTLVSTNQKAFKVNSLSISFVAGVAIVSSCLLMAIMLIIVWQQRRSIEQQLAQKQIESDYQQRMLRLALEAQENERKRVSKALHDDAGILLQTLRTTALSLTKNAPEADKNEFKTLIDQLNETVLRISWDLMPTSLERFGLVEALDELCSRFSVREAMAITFTTTGPTAPMDKNQEILLYRIVQETLDNAIRHAQASAIEIHFEWSETELCIVTRDNGIGFEMPQKNKQNINQYGLGLFNIENRAGLLQGYVSFEKNVPTGTIVRIVLPQQGYAKN
jgi:two-component system, NarL family, sensor kinase